MNHATARCTAYAHEPRRLYPEPDAAPDGPAWPSAGAGARQEDAAAAPVQHRPIAEPIAPRPGALEDLGAQLVGLHMLADRLETKLHRVLRPAIARGDDGEHPGHGPICAPHLRDPVRGANRAANRLSAILDRIDL